MSEGHLYPAPAMRTLVLSPVLRNAAAGPRTAEARLDEAVGLSRAIDLEVVHGEVVRLSQLRPSTLLGSGAVERLKAVIEAEEIGLAVVDWALTPVQQRNLEKEWSCKVIDRRGLILEIFGARARTAEGKLQVELASLSYQLLEHPIRVSSISAAAWCGPGPISSASAVASASSAAPARVSLRSTGGSSSSASPSSRKNSRM